MEPYGIATSKLDQWTKGKAYTFVECSIDRNYLVIVGDEAFTILSNKVRQINAQTQFMVDNDTWPPEQPKNFTPLLLLHCQGYRIPERVTAMAELMSTGGIDKVALVTSDQSGTTMLDSHKKYPEVLTPAEQQNRWKIS